MPLSPSVTTPAPVPSTTGRLGHATSCDMRRVVTDGVHCAWVRKRRRLPERAIIETAPSAGPRDSETPRRQRLFRPRPPPGETQRARKRTMARAFQQIPTARRRLWPQPAADATSAMRSKYSRSNASDSVHPTSPAYPLTVANPVPSRNRSMSFVADLGQQGLRCTMQFPLP